MRLDNPPWRGREGLDGLIAALGAKDVRFVGGAVRDALLELAAADLDLATVHMPAEVLRRLDAAGIRAVPTGMAHGTITAVLPSGPVEVTTLRRDLSTDGRHAVVAFTHDWRADAARRDFTINALYADPLDGTVTDYFDGLDDLQAGRVKFIGDPMQRIAEDHLRILRFFRFHARFGDVIDDQGLDACATRANDLMALSRERIAAELLKLLVAKAAVPVVSLMLARAILLPVLPEITDAAPLAALAERETAAAIEPDAIRRLAALVPAESAESVGARLKLSNAERQRLQSASGPLGSEGTRALVYRLGPDRALDRLLFHDAAVPATMDRVPQRLPISGGSLVARGLRKGPEVAAALRRVENRWIAEDFPDQPRLDELADEEVLSALRASSNA